jgi:phosphoglycerate dehydrogenase-like enzyme
VAEAGRKPVVLVGGNMGRNDGVDYSEWFARDFPDVTFYSTEGKPEVLEAHIAEADAVIGDVPEGLLARAKRLRWVSSTGAGANALSTPAFRARPEIVATTVVGVHVASVPEQTLAMLFAFARKLPEQILNQHGPHRYYWPTGMFEVEGQTMGILGIGKIGQSLARKAKGLGMRVTGWRRSDTPAPEGLLDRQFARDDLHGLLADADHVVITLPLTAETHHLIGARELAAMKHTAYLYNVGRGPILDQDALLAALRDGTIAGAGLDVTDPEPLPPDHPLWDAPNLILLTHYGGLTPKYGPRAYAILSENLRRFLRGEELLNVVDKQRGY